MAGETDSPYFFTTQTLVEPKVDSIYRGGVGCESSRKALFIGGREVAAKQQNPKTDYSNQASGTIA
jgi:hypothetical protein